MTKLYKKNFREFAKKIIFFSWFSAVVDSAQLYLCAVWGQQRVNQSTVQDSLESTKAQSGTAYRVNQSTVRDSAEPTKAQSGTAYM